MQSESFFQQLDARESDVAGHVPSRPRPRPLDTQVGGDCDVGEGEAMTVKKRIYYCSLCGQSEHGGPCNETQQAATVQIPRPLDTQVGGDHYKSMAIQPVEYIHKNGIGFAEGCVIKYVSRWRQKGGVEDLQKAKHFLELLIEMEGKK